MKRRASTRPVRWGRCRATFPAYLDALGRTVASERCWRARRHDGLHVAHTLPMQSRLAGPIYCELVQWGEA